MNEGNPGAGRAPAIAIGTAVVALVLSLVAVIVAAGRGSETAAAPNRETPVPAAELVKLRRDAVQTVSEDGKVIGVKLTDDKLREALGLEAGDVITNLAGRAIKRELDAQDAVLGAARMDVSIVHVDVLRAGRPVHLRWQLDGDLRATRRDDSAALPRPPIDTYGGLRDPLLDTIKKIDEQHFEIPRSTVDRIASNPDDFMKGARVVPSIRMGSVDGIKLYAIRPSSVFAAIGLQNGDTIRAINGFEIGSVDQLLELYSKVKDAKELAIDITRRGSYELITLTID